MMRSYLTTLPERLRLVRRNLTARLESPLLRLVDRYLAQRGEERTPRLLAFDEIPVLYDENDFGLLSPEKT